MISVRNFTRKYADLTAVDDISFDISPNQVTAFLGPNGAGKTTTLRVLSGYLYPTSGKIEIAGHDLAENAQHCRKLTGYLPENNPLYEEMEVFEFLEWSGLMSGIEKPGLRKTLDSAIEKCALSSVIGKNIGTLSRGYKQRVGLAKAILHNPQILLLDEPTSGLDPNQADETRKLLAQLKKEKTVVLSTHILSDVKAICDRVIILNKGKIAAESATSDIAVNYAGERRITLVLKKDGNQADFQEKLSKIEGVNSVSAKEDGNETVYEITTMSSLDLRERIFNLCLQEKAPMLELYRKSPSLEEIFRNLTQ
ncbi:MAG: ATP-binding cassette domain-containing protein [Elusimicrobia bacterium]|nr:ATP-binding cassette domain-containing protein [Elusimicrobiota bacterium]